MNLTTSRILGAAALGGALLAGCGRPDPTCSYSLSTGGQTLPASGGDVEIKVEAPGGCAWTFQANDPWLLVHGSMTAPSGSGAGTVVATVAANAGVRRVGTATIARTIPSATTGRASRLSSSGR